MADERRRRGRKPNTVETVPLNLNTTPQVVACLEQLAKTGMYGKNPTDVGEQLLRERLREIYGERAIVGIPPTPPAPGESSE